ncbi:signal peptide peptidase [Tanacetum coccineum]
MERVANIALAGLTLAPLVMKVEPNINVILTACLAVFVGCYRSVKSTPPTRIGISPMIGFGPIFSPLITIDVTSNASTISYEGLTLAPLVMKVDPNINVILTACLAVFVGCYRSVKSTPPTVSLTLAPLVMKVDPNINVILTACLAVFVGCYRSVKSTPPTDKGAAYVPLDVEFTRSQVVAAIPGTFFCVWYVAEKHWLANNILGLAFCIQGLGAISGSDISCVVVFKYGSVILLNVCDSEINERLEIVKVQASDVDLSSQWPPVDRDLLPDEAPIKLNMYREMHKNGTYVEDVIGQDASILTKRGPSMEWSSNRILIEPAGGLSKYSSTGYIDVSFIVIHVESNSLDQDLHRKYLHSVPEFIFRSEREMFEMLMKKRRERESKGCQFEKCDHKETGLKPWDQKLVLRGNEMDDHKHFHMVGLKGKAKVILIENLPTKTEDREMVKKYGKPLRRTISLQNMYLFLLDSCYKIDYVIILA